MAAAIGVCSDYTTSDLWVLARRCSERDQVCRLLALALIVDGGSKSDPAKFAGRPPTVPPVEGTLGRAVGQLGAEAKL